jgi:hypothetical protein
MRWAVSNIVAAGSTDPSQRDAALPRLPARALLHKPELRFSKTKPRLVGGAKFPDLSDLTETTAALCRRSQGAQVSREIKRPWNARGRVTQVALRRTRHASILPRLGAHTPFSESPQYRSCIAFVHDPQRTCRAIARAHEAYTFLTTNTTDSQPPIGREPVVTDSVRYRKPDRPRLGQPLF